MNRCWVLKSHGKELYLQFVMEKPFVLLFTTKRVEDIHKTLDLLPYAELEQVHSSKIWKIDEPFPPKSLIGDGLLTSRPRLFLVVKVADCFPLYIVDPLNLAIGIFHVGWRGLRDGIIEAAVAAFREQFNSMPEKLIAVFGPGISPEYYEVGEEFKEYFHSGIIEKDSKYYLDIFGVAAGKLKKLGVNTIYPPPHDTYSNPEWFHSKRRDVELKGLNRAIIGIEKELSIHSLIQDSPYDI